MAKFDAGASVDTLDYDFTAYVEGAKGVIPEPTNAQIEALRAHLASVMPTREDETGRTVLDIGELSKRIEEGSDLEGALMAAIAEFCSNTPSAEQLAALPYRAQRAFLGWLVGLFFSPEA